MKICAKRVLLAEGWQGETTLTIDNGVIVAVQSGYIEGAEKVGTVIPGMVNCHSHAFQRAFAGFSEQGSEGKDSFWTWRQVMYSFLRELSDQDANIIAKQLYIEMVKSGYTRVAEFHYLHHDKTGRAYPVLATMALAIFKAAKEAGIGLTLLPVMYQFSGFGPLPPTQGQSRFINSTTQFNQLVTDCFDLSKDYDNANVGIAPHSLRAVDKAALDAALKHVKSLDASAPVHIHIAEQTQEVDDCVAHYGKRPVQWLLDNMPVDDTWCLIHATHIDEQERKGIAKSGAIAGICPTTEANLGDGIYPTTEFMAEGGTIAIGSDSHISVNPVEELRWLEYAQRLIKQQRAVLADNNTPSVGRYLWQEAALGGAKSTNSNTGELAIGKQADLLVLNDEQMMSFANADDVLLDSFIFASQTRNIAHVMVNGQWVVRDGRHPLEQESHQAFSDLLAKHANQSH